MQKCQQDTYCFLLIPRKHHGKRQIVYSAFEGVCESGRNFNRTVSIVALSHIHYTGKSANPAKVQVVKSIFPTGKCKDHTIGRGLLYKFGIIAASRFRAIAAAIHSRKVHISRITAKFKSFFDDRCEVFLFTNVYEFRVRHHFCGKYTVGIACFRRHQTVGGKEDRRGNIRKFLLLILPCCAEIAFEMCIFFQFRISVCRKHFSMCIDIDAFAFRLFK